MVHANGKNLRKNNAWKKKVEKINGTAAESLSSQWKRFFFFQKGCKFYSTLRKKDSTWDFCCKRASIAIFRRTIFWPDLRFPLFAFKTDSA